MKVMVGKVQIAAGGALVLALGACSGETEAQREINAQAEAVEESFDAQADVIESLARGAPEAEQEQAEMQADALRDQGTAYRERLQEGARELRDVPAQ